MTSLGIGTLRWGSLMLLLPALVATQAHAADAPPAAPAAAAPAAAAPPADAPPAAAPAAGAPGAPAEAAGATGGGGDQGAYTVRLRGLEKNVNELKEQIFRTKARLNLLKETVLGGVIGASRALIHHKNEMGSSFRLVKAAFALDGVQIAAKSDAGLADLQEFDVYNGAIQPGSHTLSVALTYQGNGFGVFSYLKGYKFNVKSSHTFVAGESKSTNITVVGYEKGNITTQLSDKPAIDFRVNVMSAGEGGAAATATKK
jgi:nucleoid-associated protein YgaU